MTFTSEDGKNSVILIGIDADNVAILFGDEDDSRPLHDPEAK
jgi:hypothetical protein